MPRTKKASTLKHTDSKDSKLKELLLRKIDEEEKKIMGLLNAQMKEQLIDLNVRYMDVKIKFPLHMLKRNVGEIRRGEVDSMINSTKSSKKTNQTLSSRTISKRSLSLGCDDEGYTTAESTRGTTSGNQTTRQSRSRTKTSSKPISRSLSRNTTKKLTAYKTPLNKQPPNMDVGSITPKIKPNTPQTIIRRPKIGEIAWSNQGSPLLTSHTVAAESTANVNIPLPDGKLVSIFPRPGVRVSEIPAMDQDTRRQLEILRDNLIRVCSEYRND